METTLAQRCMVKGYDTVGTSCSKTKSNSREEKIHSPREWLSCEKGCPRLWSLHPYIDPERSLTKPLETELNF